MSLDPLTLFHYEAPPPRQQLIAIISDTAAILRLIPHDLIHQAGDRLFLIVPKQSAHLSPAPCVPPSSVIHIAPSVPRIAVVTTQREGKLAGYSGDLRKQGEIPVG